MPDFKVGDRVVWSRRHLVEGDLGWSQIKGQEIEIVEVKFLHKGERYYNARYKDKWVGVLHSMLDPLVLTPFEQSVRDYIRSEMKT